MDASAAWTWHDADLSDRESGANEGDLPCVYHKKQKGMRVRIIQAPILSGFTVKDGYSSAWRLELAELQATSASQSSMPPNL